jgi:hypothetical protein
VFYCQGNLLIEYIKKSCDSTLHVAVLEAILSTRGRKQCNFIIQDALYLRHILHDHETYIYTGLLLYFIIWLT